MNTSRGFNLSGQSQYEPYKSKKNWLFLIGIDVYQQLAKLNNAVKDVLDFKELLLKHYYFTEDKIFELYNERATYQNIENYWRELAEKVPEGENLLIYFSGHGHYDKFFNDGYWIPADAHYEHTQGYFSYDKIIRAIAKIKTKHTLLVVDSCYSGAILVEKTRNNFEGKNSNSDPREKDPSRWILASGRNEVVKDGIAGKNSPFAKELLDVLLRYSDEGISFLSLVDKVTTATIRAPKEIQDKQTPIGRPLQGVGDKGGQFYFWPKNSKKSQEQMAWDKAKIDDTEKAYYYFLETFPKSKFVSEAKDRLKFSTHRKIWIEAKNQNTITSLKDFINNYPGSPFIDMARENLYFILKEQNQTQELGNHKRLDSSMNFHVEDIINTNSTSMGRDMVIEKELREIKKLFSTNDYIKALNKLLDISSGDLRNEVLLLIANMNELRSAKRTMAIDQKEWLRGKLRITSAALEICDLININK